MKPTTFPVFAVNDLNNGPNGEANVSAPSLQQSNSGWLSGQYPPRQIFNWMHRLTYQWLEWTVAQHGNIFDPRDYGNGALTGTNIALACTAALAANGIVVIRGGTYTVDVDNLDFQYVPLLIEPGSYLNLESYMPDGLAIFGDPKWQLFITDNPVAIYRSAFIRPDWFFMTNSDATEALTLAIRSCQSYQYILLEGVYPVNTSIDIGGNNVVHIKGNNAQIWCNSITGYLFRYQSGAPVTSISIEDVTIKGYNMYTESNSIAVFSTSWDGLFDSSIVVQKLSIKGCTIVGSAKVNAVAVIGVGQTTTIKDSFIGYFPNGRAISSTQPIVANLYALNCIVYGVKEGIVSGPRNVSFLRDTFFDYCVNIGIGLSSNTHYNACTFRRFGNDYTATGISPTFSHANGGTISTIFYDQYGLVTFENCHFDSSGEIPAVYFVGVFEGFSNTTHPGSAIFDNCTKTSSGLVTFLFFSLFGYLENMYRITIKDPSSVPNITVAEGVINQGILQNSDELRVCDEGSLYLSVMNGPFSTPHIFSKIESGLLLLGTDRRMTLISAPEYLHLVSNTTGYPIQYMVGDKVLFHTNTEGDLEAVCKVIGYGAPRRLSNTTYDKSSLVQPNTANGLCYITSGGGTTSSDGDPVWPTVQGNTVLDGTVIWECYSSIAVWEYANRTKPSIARYAHYDSAPTNYDYSTKDGFIKLNEDKVSFCNVIGFISSATVTVTQAVPGCHLYLRNGSVEGALRIWHCLGESQYSDYTILNAGESRHFYCLEMYNNTPKFILIT